MGMDLPQIAKRLGGEVVGRNGVVCPGPGHSSKDRSLSVSFLAEDAFLVHSHAGDGWQVCRDHVSALLGLRRATPARAAVTISGAQSAARAPSLSDVDVARLALDIWHEAGPLSGTPGAIHLARRGVAYAGDALRWHARCPFGKGVRYGCMVALVRNIITNEPQAIHRTAIDSNGNKLERKALGPIGGGAVKLTADEDVSIVLGIGEGIETTLSIRTLPDLEQLPVWACLTANGIAAFPSLPGIESVWIAADNDESETGRRAADVLAQRMDAASVESVILMPREVGTDINDKVAAHA